VANVLIGYEFSGAIRREFRRLGHNAWSCDLKPAADGSKYHYQFDVFKAIEQQDWHLAIFHPVCTYLTCSAEWAYTDGPYHQKVKPGTLVGAKRRSARKKAIAEVKALRDCGIEKIAIENPRGVLSTAWRKPDQTIHPYMFGDDASKATCLWLENLPPLEIDPAQRVPGRIVDGKERWANQTDSGQNKLPPSEDRAALRSVTYPGIARATTQWAKLLPKTEREPYNGVPYDTDFQLAA
jgi:hypothetical protein